MAKIIEIPLAEIIGILLVVGFSFLRKKRSIKKQQGKAPQQKKAAARPVVFSDMDDLDDEDDPEEMMPVRPAAKFVPEQPHIDVEKPSIAPRVHVTPHLPDMFAGSMNAATGEGEDPCHEEQLSSGAAQTMPVMTERPGLALNFSGSEMVRAVIMQEVLTRPCNRRRRA